jgi:molybdopterin-guanine dinucleotide biosynthesis protein A
MDTSFSPAGVVIAGGQSRRLGQDKRRLRLWGAAGPTLLEHTLEVLAPLCSELVVVLNDAEAWPGLPARLVPDVYADAGALGGIYAGLAAVSAPRAIVVAADMPLLSAAALRAMLAIEGDYDALVPRSPRPERARNALDLEPLHAVYSRACLDPLRATLDAGRRRITDFLERVRVRVVERADLALADPEGRSFRNINTPEELEEVRRLIGAAPADFPASPARGEPAGG